MDEPLTSFINLLKASSGITALVDNRIWGQEYFREAIDDIPQKAIVVKSAGGRPLGLSARSYIRVGGERFDVLSYGETPYDAYLVDLTVWHVLRDVAKGNGIGWIRPEGGPTPLRDPHGDTPYILSIYYAVTGEK